MSYKGLVLGLFTADSAAVPSHWLYVKYFKEKYEEFLKVGKAPEFVEPTYNPFYRTALSPYATQSLVLLESLLAKNEFDRADYTRRLYETFGPNTVFDNPPKVENPSVGNPVQGGFRNASMKNFVTAYREKGPEGNLALEKDLQADCFAKIPILVAFYAGNPDLPKVVETVIRVTQDSEEAVQTSIAAAKLFEAALQGKLTAATFEAFLTGKAFQDGITDKTRQDLRAVYDSKLSSYDFATGSVGTINCFCPGAFYTTLYSLRNAFKETTNGAELFLKAIRDTIHISGCNASRAGYLGALLGAAYGPSVIPENFLKKTQNIQHYTNLADKLQKLKGVQK